MLIDPQAFEIFEKGLTEEGKLKNLKKSQAKYSEEQ